MQPGVHIFLSRTISRCFSLWSYLAQNFNNNKKDKCRRYVGDIVFEILAKTVFKFLFYTVFSIDNFFFLQSYAVTRYPILWSISQVMRKWRKTLGIEIFRQVTHFPWLCMSHMSFSYHFFVILDQRWPNTGHSLPDGTTRVVLVAIQFGYNVG